MFFTVDLNLVFKTSELFTAKALLLSGRSVRKWTAFNQSEWSWISKWTFMDNGRLKKPESTGSRTDHSRSRSLLQTVHFKFHGSFGLVYERLLSFNSWISVHFVLRTPTLVVIPHDNVISKIGQNKGWTNSAFNPIIYYYVLATKKSHAKRLACEQLHK